MNECWTKKLIDGKVSTVWYEEIEYTEPNGRIEK